VDKLFPNHRVYRSITAVFLLLLLVGCAGNQMNQAAEPPDSASVQRKADTRSKPPLPEPKGATAAEELPRTVSIPQKKMLDAPIIKQHPELKYGCEVTSLAMLLRHAGYDADKLTLARQVKKDPEPLVQKNGDIREWGDPSKGFVGDMTGKRKGFAVYNKPLEQLMRRYMGDRTVNLTGQPFESLIRSVAEGKPVVVWATGDFTMPTEWESWRKDGKKIVAPFDEHVVLLVGYDPTYAYVNDPLSGVKQQRVTRTALKKSWEALGKQALSYR
jgi:uncharacterized protein YvpB